jgi:ribosomal protein S18 acetylase RimI-like enzyme
MPQDRPLATRQDDVARIRSVTIDDAPAVSRIYESVFPARRLSRLGPDVLVSYFRFTLDTRGGIGQILQSQTGEVLGFAVGHLGRLPLRSARVLKHVTSLILGLGWSVLSHPRLLAELLRGASAQVSLRGGAGDALLTAICLRPESRGHGNGRRLLDAFIREARNAGAERVLLEVDRDATPALNLYRQIGFTEVAASAGPCATMVLDLSPNKRP